MRGGGKRDMPIYLKRKGWVGCRRSDLSGTLDELDSHRYPHRSRRRGGAADPEFWGPRFDAMGCDATATLILGQLPFPPLPSPGHIGIPSCPSSPSRF